MKLRQCGQLLQIFWTFFKISPVTFGGGFAMMPIMKEEAVNRKKWMNEAEIVDVFALVRLHREQWE